MTVNEECLTEYNKLKLRKGYKYLIFGINDSLTEIVIKKKADDSTKAKSNQDAYAEFLTNFSKGVCGWGVFDFEFEKVGDGIRNKLIFFAWYVSFFFY